MNRPGRWIALPLAAALLGWGSAAIWAEDQKPSGRPEKPPGPAARTVAPPGIPGGPVPATPSVIPPPPGFPAPPTTTAPTSAPLPTAAPAPTAIPPPPTPNALLGAVPAPAPPLPGGGTFAGVIGTLQVQVNDPADAQALALALGLTVRQVSPDQRVFSFVAPPGVDLVTLLHRLRADPRVKAAELEALEFPLPAR